MATKKGKGKPLAKQRRCSVCGLPGHTKAAHKKKPITLRTRKKVRRNLDAFTGVDGAVHPIRGTEGYIPIAAGEDRYLRSTAQIRQPAIEKLSDSILAREISLATGKSATGKKLTGADTASIKKTVVAQRRRLTELLKKHSAREAREKRQHEADRRAMAASFHSESRKQWKGDLRRAIKSVSPSGIAPHNRTRGGSALHTEYRLDVPINLRNRRGLPADQVADLLKRELSAPAHRDGGRSVAGAEEVRI